MIRALLGAVVILLLTVGTAAAASRCLSRSEAKALWPRTYLYWTVVDKRRCWSNKRGRHYAMQVSDSASRRVYRPPPPPPLLYVPPELVPQKVDPPPEPPTLLADWDWIEKAQTAVRQEPVFSTFKGEPPDVWPAKPETNLFQVFFFLVGSIGAVLLLMKTVLVSRTT